MVVCNALIQDLFVFYENCYSAFCYKWLTVKRAWVEGIALIVALWKFWSNGCQSCYGSAVHCHLQMWCFSTAVNWLICNFAFPFQMSTASLIIPSDQSLNSTSLSSHRKRHPLKNLAANLVPHRILPFGTQWPKFWASISAWLMLRKWWSNCRRWFPWQEYRWTGEMTTGFAFGSLPTHPQLLCLKLMPQSSLRFISQ